MSKIIVNTLERKSKINRNIYGNFSEHLGRCIYNGVYVGENSDIPNVNGMRTDVVEALKHIKLPVLRWPGGCFADEYHWKDGIGPKENRKKMVNTHWGGVVEDNSFGTHEFLELCRQIGCEPYINGNVGSGTVQEMSEWMEYMTFDGVSPMAALRAENGHPEPWKVKYFGVGNENWGCGGNMRPSYYADLYRRYQTYVRDYGENRVFRIACGPNADDYNWTEEVMRIAGRYMDGLSLHYYTVPGFLYQQSTMRDAMVAALTLNIFNAHSDRVAMANIAQLVNVLQAVILTEGEKMVCTPTYHVFDLYKHHQDATLLGSFAETAEIGADGETIQNLSVSASEDDAGAVHITVANLSATESCPAEITLLGRTDGAVQGRILTGRMDAYNDFDCPENVSIRPMEGLRLENGQICCTLPACSVAEITIA